MGTRKSGVGAQRAQARPLVSGARESRRAQGWLAIPTGRRTWDRDRPWRKLPDRAILSERCTASSFPRKATGGRAPPIDSFEYRSASPGQRGLGRSRNQWRARVTIRVSPSPLGMRQRTARWSAGILEVRVKQVDDDRQMVADRLAYGIHWASALSRMVPCQKPNSLAGMYRSCVSLRNTQGRDARRFCRSPLRSARTKGRRRHSAARLLSARAK